MELKLEALFDAVIVKPIELEETNYGSIIIPDMGNQTNETAEVIAIGPGRYTISGEIIPSMLKVGDKVILPTMGFTKFEYNGTTYYVGRENEVLAKIN